MVLYGSVMMGYYIFKELVTCVEDCFCEFGFTGCNFIESGDYGWVDDFPIIEYFADDVLDMFDLIFGERDGGVRFYDV